MPNWAELSRDGWAGFAAMLVAMPASIAYGVAIYSILGPDFVAQGAIAGVIGAVILGLIASLFGGAPRLISAPCAPAAALMTSLAVDLLSGSPERVSYQPQQALLLMTAVALMAGGLQLVYGVIGGGRLIKYIPYPVISGYLSAVGITILLGQLPKFFGFERSISLWQGLVNPNHWQWPSLIAGGFTILGVLTARKITKAIPPPIFGLTAGVASFFGMSASGLLRMNPDHLVVGAVGGDIAAVGGVVVNRWSAIGGFTISDVTALGAQALTLSILLSIDTLKSCVVVDALTRSRHNSNRELIGQGFANLASAAAGGLPGAGTLGPTLVNINSGGRTRWSGVFEGAFVAVAFLLFSGAIGRLPLAALSGLLIVVSLRMIDRSNLYLLRHKSTVLDFLVIAAVIIVALRFNLVAAAGAGLGLSILLFIREQIRGSVIRRKLHGDQISSKQHRLPAEKETLSKNAALITVCQLQGSLFFGTTDQLFNELEGELKRTRYLILDMTRVQSVDFTAAHMLEQIEGILKDNRGQLIFANMPPSLPTGQHLETYFSQLELVTPTRSATVFGSLDEALEWAENKILEEMQVQTSNEDAPLELDEIDLFRDIEPKALALLKPCAETRDYAADQNIFRMGDAGDELFLIRKGLVRIVLQLDDGRRYTVTTFAQGDFFGDMAFLDRGTRSADAFAIAPTELYAISRRRFDEIVCRHPCVGFRVFAALARALAVRLRYADAELQAAHES